MMVLLQKLLPQELLANVPVLPASIRYYDDFSDSYITLTNPSQSDQWELTFDGSSTLLDFCAFDPQIRPFIKSWCAHLLATLAPCTTDFYTYGIRRVPVEQLIEIVSSTPQTVASLWKIIQSGSIPYFAYEALKSILSFLCTHHVGYWGSEWLDLVSQLPLPKRDKYASVRMGDVFLSFEEEAAIIQHIDDVSARILASRLSITDGLLESTAILLCSYQFAFRAKQIAMLEMRNIRIWNDGIEEVPAVHLTFTMIKQRNAKRVFPMVRRVKREWSPIFIELFDRVQVSQSLAHLTGSLLPNSRSTRELRHTAALRLVDAGASEEELAAFMGHSDLNTGLVYFNSSRSQAERINQALGVSSTYQNVLKIAHGRFITPEEHAEMKGDQQIGGVPHGIPIAGIGGCSSGQPSCPFNPIMSCYGCSRFMPVAIAAIHKEVLEDLRGVMKFFYTSSHAERGSPALQLERTISNVQAVLSELGEKPHELES